MHGEQQNADQSVRYQAEDQAMQEEANLNDSDMDQQIGYQTMRYNRSWFFEKFSDINKSLVNEAGGSPMTKSSKNISIRKNKFRTFPKSCLKNKGSKSWRFDRTGAKIPSQIIENYEYEDNTDESKHFHISFRDDIKRKSLIKIFEVESYKKYNSDGNWWWRIWWEIF